jgi:hypothetical protein
MNVEAPWVHGPPDPAARHCDDRARSLEAHVEGGCVARYYSDADITECAARGIAITDDDQHDDCEYVCTADDDCKCACADCRAVIASIEAYDRKCDPSDMDDDHDG